MSELGADPVGLRVRVEFRERSRPTLRGLSSALFDFNLLYELAVLVSDRSYEGYRYSEAQFWRRNGRPIRQEHRGVVEKVFHGSPLDLILVIPAAILTSGGGLWAWWQFMERLLDRPLNRRILEENMRRAHFEANLAQLDYEERLAQLGAAPFADRLFDRIQAGELVPAEVDVEGDVV